MGPVVIPLAPAAGEPASASWTSRCSHVPGRSGCPSHRPAGRVDGSVEVCSTPNARHALGSARRAWGSLPPGWGTRSRVGDGSPAPVQAGDSRGEDRNVNRGRSKSSTVVPCIRSEAGDGHSTVVHVHDGPDDGQAQAGATRPQLRRAGATPEPLEDVGHLVGRDAHSGVRDRETGAVRGGGDARRPRGRLPA